MGNNPTRAQAIKAILEKRTHPDLASLYTASQEVQVNVGRDGGERAGAFNGYRSQSYTDGASTWFPFRVPKNAASDPEDNSGIEMTYALGEHAEAIGMTGWDFIARRSRWHGFDFDAIVGHSEKHQKKLSDDELLRVSAEAQRIPWVTVRRSTSGSGLHLYVFHDPPIPTANHTEHAALGRAILHLMSAQAGFDFDARVDACGGNIWVWGRKMTKANRGLELVKQGEPLRTEPPEWRRHVGVIRGERKKALPTFVASEDVTGQEAFDELAGQHPRVKLDEEHKKLIEWLSSNQGCGWYDADHHMLVTHTHHLKRAHEALAMRGPFDTTSPATQLDEQNCFSGKTEVVTKVGIRTLKELSLIGHGELLVQTLNGLAWKDVEVKSFGIQTTYPVVFGNRTQVRATKEHAWLYRDTNTRKVDFFRRKFTFELDDKIVLPQTEIELPVPSNEGYAHGFVFGDGWRREHRNGTWTTEVAMFKEDEALMSLLCQYGSLGYQKYGEHENVPSVRGLPAHWKDLPENPSREYAFGFILGLISADGFVNNQVQVSQSNIEHIEGIRHLAQWIGIRVNGMQYISPTTSSYANAKKSYKLTFSSYNFKPEHFLRKDHKHLLKIRKKCIGTTATMLWELPEQEEVFCAIVPQHHNFVLANQVITGNCFAFPIRRGGWAIRRYTKGIGEANTWEQDGRGYTKCYLNREPDLGTASRAKGGVEDKRGAFAFQQAEVAADAAKQLGASLELPVQYATRPAKLSAHKDGKRLVLEMEHFSGDDPKGLNGFYIEKGKWVAVLAAPVMASGSETEIGLFDDVVRHAVTEAGVDAGWFARVDASWHHEPGRNIQLAMLSLGKKKLEVDCVMGASVLKPWKLCNRPFEEEYPGDRLWNKSQVQFRYAKTDEVGEHPHWDSILEHCGIGLNDALSIDGWAQVSEVKTGAEYLKLWLAAALQSPYEPLPYLFMYGNQNCGKSIFHESINLLITDPGVIEINNALEDKERFNAEMEGAIFCVVEEKNLRKNKTAYERIKNWVTNPKLMIHKKNLTPYSLPNHAHFIHSANDHEAFPIFPNDTRITMICVPDLKTGQMIPKTELRALLKKEAPHFLNTLLRLEIPPTNDRLRIPVVSTSEKEAMAKTNRSSFDEFLEMFTFHVPGKMVPLGEFYSKFQEWLQPYEQKDWHKNKCTRSMPPHFPVGKRGGVTVIGNMSWAEAKPGEPVLRGLVLREGLMVEIQ